MQITDIEVTVSRKRNPAQYEDANVGVKLNAKLADGEDYARALGMILDTAAYAVAKRLGLDSEGKPVFGETIAAVTVKAADGQTVSTAPTTVKAPKAPKAEKTAADRGQISTNPENRVDPAQSEIPTAAQAAAPAAVVVPAPVAEIPATPAPAPAPTAAEEVSAEGLSSYISDKARAKQNGGKGFSVEQVHALRTEFGVSRLADLKPEQRGPFKIALEKLVS